MIIDVAALDVLDSFGSRTLRNIAEMARLRGAITVIVGIQPDVAFAMVLLGMDTGTVHTALDLEEGLTYLATRAGSGATRGRATPMNTAHALQRDCRVAFLRCRRSGVRVLPRGAGLLPHDQRSSRLTVLG